MNLKYLWVKLTLKIKTLHQETEWARNIKVKQLEIVHCILTQVWILKPDAAFQLGYIHK